ncbi:unnamed protein product [Scytosiphon promiscuus]
MKRFCYNIFILFIIILLFNGILFLFGIRQYYIEYEKRPAKNFGAFIFADSHGLPISDFSEKYNVFNFSAGSDSYFDMKRKISYLLENGYNVDTIFITVDDHTLSPYREILNNLDRSAIYYSLPIEYENQYEFLKEKYLRYYLPIFQPKISSLFKSYLEAKLEVIYQPNNKSLNDKVWSDFTEDDRIKSAEGRIKLQFPSDNKSEKLERTLLEIIHLCQTNEIKLIGIKFPLSSSYLKVLDSRNYGADELLTSKGLNVKDNKEIFKENPEYFFNTDHLNSKGGEIFTKMLLSR